MKLYGVRVFVDDLDAARRFYLETLGLSETWRADAMGAFGASVGEPELIIELADAAAREEGLLRRFVGVSLQVDDIAATHADLVAKGVRFVSPPEQQPWGGSLAHFQDSAGNVLTLLG